MTLKNTFEFLSADWKDVHEIVLYGFGKLAWGNIDAIQRNFKIVAIIDNDVKYKGKRYKDIPILSLIDYEQSHIRKKIVVTTSGSRYKDIFDTLIKVGYIENKDFCSYTVLCNDYYWNLKKKIFIGRLTFNLTTFCSLNCKNCTMLTPYNHNKTNFDYDSVIEDIDLTFRFVDYVSNFIIAGGEPLLYKDLKLILKYVGEKYSEYVGKIQVITNGTIEISSDLLEVIKKYDVEVRISDYNLNVQYSEKLSRLCSALDKNNVKYVRFIQDTWLDMGFPHEQVNTGDSSQDIRRHMLNCAPNCQNINGGKLYYCAQGWAADQTGLFHLDIDDSLDLNMLIDDKEGKEKFRKFYFGELNKGYFSFCKVCRGWDTNITIPGGEQYDETKC